MYKCGERTLNFEGYFNHYLPFFEGYSKRIKLIRKPKVAAQNSAVDAYVRLVSKGCKKKWIPTGYKRFRLVEAPMELTLLNAVQAISGMFTERKAPYREFDGGAHTRSWEIYVRDTTRTAPTELPHRREDALSTK